MARLRAVDDALMDQLRDQARTSPRRRQIFRLHEHADRVQRMLNCFEPDSYVRPHKHEDPDKVELFVALRGKAAVLEFDDAGEIVATVVIAARGQVRAVEIPPRSWHMVVALEPGTTLFEISEGPYDAQTHKRWAPWAPAEDSPQAASYLAEVRARLET